MPLDSRDTRASAVNVGLPFGRVLPQRDGLIDATDFEQLGYSYRGLPAEFPPPTFITPPRVVFIGPSALAAKASTFGILTWESGAVHASGFSAVRPLRWEGTNNDASGETTLDILTWDGQAAPAELISEAP